MKEEILKIFDAYELVARVYPAILVSLPIMFTCYSFSGLINSPLLIKISSGSLVVLVGVALVSNVVRFFGKQIEPKLWKNWDGAPSTRFLRADDNKIAKEVKDKLYKKLLKDTGMELGNGPSDEKIIQGFGFIRNILRKKDKEGLWNKHNKEYGFARNLMGSRWVWIILSFGLSLISYMATKVFPADITLLIIGATLNFIWGVVGIICGWIILPGLTKGIAERYAEEAILSYITLD